LSNFLATAQQGSDVPTLPTDEEMIAALQAKGLFPDDIRAATTWYNTAIISKLQEIRDGGFSTAVLAAIPTWQAEYSSRFQLFTEPSVTELDFVPKPFMSVVNKLYREAILSKEPSTFPFTECFSRFDDLVRTTLASPYGDGPIFIAEKLNNLAEERKLSKSVKRRGNDFGYYAIHFSYDTRVELLDFPKPEVVEVDLTAEIQLTTQLQLSLRTLTHKLYERRRLNMDTTTDWKWEFDNELFRPSYTGHTLHLLESLLLEMKNAEDDRGAK
jgi:hypothetical protein